MRTWAGVGPPPLARGELAADFLDSPRVRTTPARAGRTRTWAGVEGESPDHPRSRGENSARSHRSLTRTGPPPLARGEQQEGPPPDPGGRTTPARAGRTLSPSCWGAATTDHPRSRGENACGVAHSCAHAGPPPLARGELKEKLKPIEVRRTTPARAGRTVAWSLELIRRADHPRSRGENGHDDAPTRPLVGPPPLARGELRQAKAGSPHHRTTPARAGRTLGVKVRSRSRTDHPRSRGENGVVVEGVGERLGPPPLARGERLAIFENVPNHRTTPARAGRTVPARSRGAPAPDHPRSRGENDVAGVRRLPRSGPPPLARGEQPHSVPMASRSRTTPARAGRTPGLLVGAPLHRGPPPLARGELALAKVEFEVGRTTPARAGRTSPAVSPAPTTADHPRSRGENGSPAGAPSQSTGPPPLARGEPTGSRVIPRSSADHPRSRGENALIPCARSRARGPPPLARGEPG